MTSVADEKFLMVVEESVTKSVNDPLDVLLPDPKDPEGFQSLLFLDRTLSYDQCNDLYLPFSVYFQDTKTC